MKYLSKFIVFFLFLFFFFSTSMSEEKNAFIDIDFLIQNSNVGKRVLKNISDLNQININQLEKKNKSLKELEIQIKNKQKIISKQDFNNEVESFQQKIQDFNNEKNKIVKEFNDYRKLELEKVFKTFNPIISNYMKINSIKILLDSKYIFMGNPDTNVTNDILKIINKEIK